jgi:hydrogenase nickel incorporation protein HypA/HybF
MHEYAVTKEIIRIAEEACQREHAESVAEINLTMGEECGYLPECIELYFDLIASDSLCAKAKLNFSTIQPKLRCENCGELFVRRPFSFECPLCGGQGLPTDIGREFYVDSVKVTFGDDTND